MLVTLICKKVSVKPTAENPTPKAFDALFLELENGTLVPIQPYANDNEVKKARYTLLKAVATVR